MKCPQFAALLGVAASLTATPVVFAQTATATPPTANRVGENLHYFNVTNVPPSLMATWLDPVHYPGLFGKYTGRPTKETNSLPLPASVGRMIPVDDRKILAVEVANPQDASSLQELITALDQPRQRMEIEIQFVQMNEEDAKQFIGRSFPDTTTAGTFNVGSVRNNFAAKLNALLADKKVQIFSAPRATVIDGVGASFANNEHRMFTTPSAQPNQIPTSLVFDASLRLNLVPAVTEDGFVTLAIAPIETDIRLEQNDTDVPRDSNKGASIIAQLRDGGTLVLQGTPKLSENARTLLKKYPSLEGQYPTYNQEGREFMIFVTTRILKNSKG